MINQDSQTAELITTVLQIDAGKARFVVASTTDKEFETGTMKVSTMTGTGPDLMVAPINPVSDRDFFEAAVSGALLQEYAEFVEPVAEGMLYGTSQPQVEAAKYTVEKYVPESEIEETGILSAIDEILPYSRDPVKQYALYRFGNLDRGCTIQVFVHAVADKDQETLGSWQIYADLENEEGEQ